MNRIWASIKSILWILAEFIIFVIIMVPITYGLNMAFTGIFHLGDSYNIAEHPLEILAIEYLPLFIASMISLFITHTLIFKRAWPATGFVRAWYSAGTIRAATLAVVILGLSFIGLYIVGYMAIEKIDFDATLFFGLLILFIVQSSFEEVVSRSFMIPSITSRSNVWVALFISSALFAVLHLFNDNITVLSTLNIFLAGALLGILYIRYESIWPAISFHAAWNFFQGSFFGFEVSGNEVYSYLDTTETGPDLLTGGTFGFEGSIICTLLLIIYTAYLYKKWSKSDQFIRLGIQT